MKVRGIVEETKKPFNFKHFVAPVIGGTCGGFMNEQKLTRSEAAKYFALDEEHGLVWNCDRKRVHRGMRAGFMLNGCRYVVLEGQRLQAKKIVWLLMHGTWPARPLYHRDRNPENITYSNLTARRIAPRPTAPRVEIKDEGDSLTVYSYGRGYFSSEDRAQVLAAVSRLLLN